ncbi:MAG TPA: NADPH:quinone reductase [Acidimicrobiales bacterium]|nr:NADPH:quinone reductase [Acidimicrobiales bacterium]
MRACVYRKYGGPEVLEIVERPRPVPGPGEVLVQVAVSGVNPTDWKTRRGATAPVVFPYPEVVPQQDGAGVIAEVGEGCDAARKGERVWIWESAWQRAEGTAQEYVALAQDHAVHLPDTASFDLGASLGIPTLTAHRCLTVGANSGARLGRGSLSGRTVLVAGGAGAVGHAAIELARWSGASILTTVSSPEKAVLAADAGAHTVINYRTEDVVAKVREVAPQGVDLIVEVNPVANAEIDREVLAPDGTVAVYAAGTRDLSIPVRPAMTINACYQFVLIYTVPRIAKTTAVEDVSAALDEGALRVGKDAGLPLHRFPLEAIRDAQAAVESGVTGKVLVEIAELAEES